ncbi:uncharacterized protein PAE49_016948 [Odontesthes bonariensis]
MSCPLEASHKMAMKMREWRKRQRDMDQLRYSDSEDEHRSMEINCNVESGTQSSCSSEPGTPHSLTSDSVPGTECQGCRAAQLPYSIGKAAVHSGHSYPRQCFLWR